MSGSDVIEINPEIASLHYVSVAMTNLGCVSSIFVALANFSDKIT
ncbi:MAG: hypothetical protein AAF208_00405 [Cyanobacteria bacterium P01_A01_bin.45]